MSMPEDKSETNNTSYDIHIRRGAGPRLQRARPTFRTKGPVTVVQQSICVSARTRIASSRGGILCPYC